MRNIGKIFKTDWLNIIKTPVALFLIVALMILPSLYAWFNLKASWDPYSNTSDIAIAVTNEDIGATIRDEDVNVGNQIVTNLKENDGLGWQFVSKQEAEEGVRHGDFYASIYIPEDFSEKIGTLLGDEQTKPEIIYNVNEKINAIAPKMASSGATSIIGQTSDTFIETVSEAVLTIFNDIGIELEEELPTIRNIEGKIFALEDRLPDIEEMGNKAIQLEDKIPEINKQAEKILELEAEMPAIMDAAQTVVKLEDKLPEIKKVGDEILIIQEKMPEIQRIADAIIEVDENFNQVEQLVSDALVDIQKAQEVVSRAQDALPEVERIAETGTAYADAMATFLEENKDAFDTVAPVLKQNLLLYQQTAEEVHQFALALDNDELSSSEIEEKVPALKADVQASITSIDQSVQVMEAINQQQGDDGLTSDIEQIQALQVNFEEEYALLTEMQQSADNIPQGQIDQLVHLSEQAVVTSTDMVDRFDETINPLLNSGLGQLQEDATNASEDIQQAQENLPEVKTILENTEKSLQYGEEEINLLQEQLPEIGEEIHQTATTINEKIDDVMAGIDQAADFYQNSFPEIEKKIHQAADFVNNDLPEAAAEIAKVADFIENKLPQVEEAVGKIADLVRDDLPGLEDSVRNTADKIREFESEQDLADIIKLLKNDIEQESDFLAEPIELKENKVFPIPNYGSANSPFYTTLSLWVGALLLISLLRVDVANKDELYKHTHIYFGRGLTFASIGIMQALIVTLGDMFILDAYVAEPIWFVIFGIFISIVFMSIVYTLVSVFGNVGKGVAIIFLVLQLSGSGGTFPIQVAPPFFQAIHPYLPFTYAISLLREAVGGMVLGIVIRDILVLLAFMIVAIMFAVFLKKPLAKKIEHVSNEAKKSGLIH
ncbi:YhgE/Pip domain-containing protein [Paraliobacillus sediminis]|uniref:YhgE/Pip domain-containing protein n=1 Tax=Paraliobacillus sediminis TaxID=1885916 RepID=UPI000E3B59A1|nr:YhgE/Pip domain-containing protein [Paraliobacillus sediminis]